MRREAFSLLEMLLVVVILATVALALVRGTASTESEQKLEIAASEVAAALRFARSEAIRTGQYHGARIGAADERLRVYRLDTSNAPPVEDYSVYHPVDKRLYDLDVEAGPFSSGVEVLASAFLFGGNPVPFESVCFDPSGTPVSPVDLSLLDVGAAVLQYGSEKRGVAVTAMTGRVTVQ